MKSKFSIKSHLVLGLFFWVFFLQVTAQQDLQIEHITTEQGLSQGAVFDILQDQEGFLWIGTKDGLNRYDGYQFKVFTNDPDDPWSISGNTIVQLFEDSAGRIWAASHNSGINIYDKKTGRFHHIRHDPQDPSSLSGDHVSSIVEDTSGYFIVVVEERDINMFRLDEDFFLSQKPPQIIRIAVPTAKNTENTPQTLVKGIVKDAKDRVWVGGQDVLYQLDVQKATLRPAIEGYSIGTVYPNADGSVWASGHVQPLFLWDGTQVRLFSGEISGHLDIGVDQRENMWYARADSLFGLNLRDWEQDTSKTQALNRYFFRWQPNYTAGDYPFKSMLLDHSGIIWAGTNGNGLYKLNTNHLYFAHHLPGLSVRLISVLSPQDLSVYSYSEGWYDQDGHFLVFDPTGNNKAFEEFSDFCLLSRSGDYWIRLPQTHNGLTFLKRFNPLTNTSQYYQLDWRHYDSQPMIECQDGSVWMAGYDELLSHFDPLSGKTISYSLKDGKIRQDEQTEKRLLSYERSTSLFEDADGTLWVGTEHGFVKCIRPISPDSPIQVTRFKNMPGEVNSLSYDHVTHIMADPVAPERFLWICTKGGGINRFDKTNGDFKRLTQRDGLPDNVIYGMLEDNAGNLWGSTNKGLFCMNTVIDSNDNEMAGYRFRNFSKADGLQENEFNTGAFAKLPDGRLAFGGVNGYNIFKPEEVLSITYQPRTFITNILINNQPVVPGDETSVLENTIEFSPQITLTHQQDILTLEFASLDFNASKRNKYRYQLVGAEDTWVEAGNRRSATFLHLSPNNYLFRVQGSNSQGVWSEHIAELSIRVLPPWWKTWWAYGTYLALIAALFYAYLRFYINREKLRQELVYEKREADRIKDLDALKTQLYMNMTHEFRTPLTIILGMAQQVKEHPKEHFHNGLNMIIRNGQNLLGLVNKMLNLSKLESGKMTLELVQGDIVQFLRNMVESFRSYAANKEIHLHFLPEVDSVMMDFDKDKLQQVVSNLISNAFKFTPVGGHIYFNVRKEEETIAIRVKDTGRGIPAADLDKVFDRFYQVDNSATRQYEGSGIGLALSKELVNLMKGEISVQSPPIGTRKGAEFIVVLPIRQEAEIQKKPVERRHAEAIENPTVQDLLLVEEQNEPSVNTGEPALVKASPEKKNTDKPLILLVEDNADVVAYVASCLSDYRLAVGENGQEGLDMAIELIPDLIISDVMMPVMDGFELCRQLKSDKRTDHIPVIMLTARADLDSKLEGLELGANAYLPKPYDKQELLLNIKNLFNLRDKLQLHYQSIAGLAEVIEEGDDNLISPKPENVFVVKVRELIEAHLSDFDFTVEQLAKELYLSHSQFGRKLDALTGFSPNRFVRNIRLNKAKELLQDPELSITAIAYDCGFSDPSYFTRVFKKEFGKTPVEWRMQPSLGSGIKKS